MKNKPFLSVVPTPSSRTQNEPEAFPSQVRQPWEWACLVAILLLAAGLRLWGLEKNGFGNPYYASAVRSMLISWHNFFFVSFDPTGWVTVDKPPVALWIQAAFAKVLGYKAFSLILPQVLEGLGSIALVHHLVRRHFDAWAALMAGLTMALTPVCVAVDRYNNVDACLVLMVLLAAWLFSIAVETSNRWYLMGSMAMMGVAFNTKMMAAFVVLPAFYIVYWFGAKISWGKRLAHLVVASLVLAVVSLSWPLTVDLTAPEDRPFVGSTQDNSMISLSLGWNGFQRLLRGRGRGFQRPMMPPTISGQSVTGQPALRANQRPDRNSRPTSAQASLPPATPNGFGPRPNGGRGGRGGMMGSGEPGITRLADRNMAGQMAWFLPLALVGLFLTWGQRPTLWPLSSIHRPLLLWACWFLLYAAVFSFMRGAMHPYYLVLLAPPLAALSGIGLRTLWLETLSGNPDLLSLTLLLTFVWQAFIVAQFPDWAVLLLPILLGCGAAVVVTLTVQAKTSSIGKVIFSLGIVILFFCPFLWALSPVLGSGTAVEANPDLLTGDTARFDRGFGANNNIHRLSEFLKANRHGEKYIVAAQNSQAVAPLIIQTGEPAIALGGFMGGDPIVTVHEFAEMVKEGQIRYFFLQGNGGPGQWGQPGGQQRPGGNGGFGGFNRGGAQAEIAQWVRDNGVPVDAKLWRVVDPRETAQAPVPGAFGFNRRGAQQLYELKSSNNPLRGKKTRSKLTG
jgi:4-amino-4-deoxy-L-arabinose transferase-like glycosyltransferase